MDGNIFWNILGSITMFFVGGVFWAMLDERYGIGMRRWWHKMTHKTELPASDQRGFIVGQNAQRKIAAATVLSTLGSLYTAIRAIAFTGAPFNFFEEMLVFLFQAGFMVIGFYSVRSVRKLKDVLLHRVAPRLDELEEKEFNPVVVEEPLPTPEPKQIEPQAQPVALPAEPEPVQEVLVAPTPEPEPTLSPRDRLAKFRNRQ
jgi:hypothetical protein